MREMRECGCADCATMGNDARKDRLERDPRKPGPARFVPSSSSISLVRTED